jgi:hypothetical protein
MRKDLGTFICCYIKQQMATFLGPKSSDIFECKKCDFNCRKQSQYDRHVMTRKHQSATNSNNFGTVSSSYTCDNCNKTYQDRTGLWRHKKKCSVAIVEPTTIALHVGEDAFEESRYHGKCHLEESRRDGEDDGDNAIYGKQQSF